MVGKMSDIVNETLTIDVLVVTHDRPRNVDRLLITCTHPWIDQIVISYGNTDKHILEELEDIVDRANTARDIGKPGRVLLVNDEVGNQKYYAGRRYREALEHTSAPLVLFLDDDLVPNVALINAMVDELVKAKKEENIIVHSGPYVRSCDENGYFTHTRDHNIILSGLTLRWREELENVADSYYKWYGDVLRSLKGNTEDIAWYVAFERVMKYNGERPITHVKHIYDYPDKLWTDPTAKPTFTETVLDEYNDVGYSRNAKKNYHYELRACMCRSHTLHKELPKPFVNEILLVISAHMYDELIFANLHMVRAKFVRALSFSLLDDGVTTIDFRKKSRILTMNTLFKNIEDTSLVTFQDLTDGSMESRMREAVVSAINGTIRSRSIHRYRIRILTHRAMGEALDEMRARVHRVVHSVVHDHFGDLNLRLQSFEEAARELAPVPTSMRQLGRKIATVAFVEQYGAAVDRLVTVCTDRWYQGRNDQLCGEDGKEHSLPLSTHAELLSRHALRTVSQRYGLVYYGVTYAFATYASLLFWVALLILFLLFGRFLIGRRRVQLRRIEEKRKKKRAKLENKRRRRYRVRSFSDEQSESAPMSDDNLSGKEGEIRRRTPSLTLKRSPLFVSRQWNANGDLSSLNI